MNSVLGYFESFITSLEMRTVLFLGLNVIYIFVGLYLLIAKRNVYGLIFYIIIWAATVLFNVASRNFQDVGAEQLRYGIVDSFFLLAGLQVLFQVVYDFATILLRTILGFNENDDHD